MTHKNEYIDDEELLALADGQLDRDPRYRAQLEEAIARDSKLARRAAVFQAQTTALRQAFEPRLADPVPPRLLAALDDAKGAGSSRRMAKAAAVFALTIGAGGAGWMAASFHAAPSGPWTAAAFGKVSLGGGENADTDEKEAVSFVDQGSVRIPEWLSRKVAFRIRLPDLSPLGFKLVEREEVEIAGVRALRLDYRNRDGHSLNLFLRPRWNKDDTGLHVTEHDGVAFASWMDGPLTSAIATRLPREQAIAIATMVRRALHESAQEASSQVTTIQPEPSPAPSLLPVPPPGQTTTSTQARPVAEKTSTSLDPETH